ncbi:hypothetical protein KJ735_01645, partial [Patescibacteria group bacterium]|nr:hypothetical protein [Patescibacteria group bacterium]
KKTRENEDRQAIIDLENEIKKLETEKENSEIKLKEINNSETELLEQYSLLQKMVEKEKDSNRDAEKSLFRIVAEQNDIRNKLTFLESRKSKIEYIENDFNQELQEAGILVGVSALRYKDFWPVDSDGLVLTIEQIVKESRQIQEEKKHAIEKIKIRLEDAGIIGSDEVVKEYKETTERDVFLERELEDLVKSAESLKNLIKELEEKLAIEFRNGIEKINIAFNQFFSTMFGGGSASLSIIKVPQYNRKKSDLDLSLTINDNEKEEEEKEEDGLDIEVSLPKKKIKGLMMLSGGERALISIALLFGLSQVNPPPFIILDETDAALDEANSKKYGNMIVELSKYSQLILITHNRETMTHAGIIYGVTMGADGISRLLSIQFEEAVSVAK